MGDNFEMKLRSNLPSDVFYSIFASLWVTSNLQELTDPMMDF